ncbi:MAG: archease [Candidatus Nanohaloarchaea archaeon]|nr:archease [Candidatus Nanohaloarchaea archaeon]
MTGFELLDHTSEVGFEAHGGTLAEAFEQAGRAVFQIMTDVDELAAVEDVDISVESENLEALLYDFVDELIYIADTEHLLLARFDLVVEETPDGYQLAGTGTGQQIDPAKRHQEVKAPTYSEISITEQEGDWVLRMFVDV